MKLKTRLWLTLSQIANQFYRGGFPDEPLSARSYREALLGDEDAERVMYWLDRILGQGHCQRVYNNHVARQKSRMSEGKI